MGLRRSIHPMVQRKQNKMTPTELKQAADEMVGVFGPYMAIAHCKRVIEVLGKFKSSVFPESYIEQEIRYQKSILSELEGRVK